MRKEGDRGLVVGDVEEREHGQLGEALKVKAEGASGDEAPAMHELLLGHAEGGERRANGAEGVDVALVVGLELGLVVAHAEAIGRGEAVDQVLVEVEATEAT